MSVGGHLGLERQPWPQTSCLMRCCPLACGDGANSSDCRCRPQRAPEREEKNGSSRRSSPGGAPWRHRPCSGCQQQSICGGWLGSGWRTVGPRPGGQWLVAAEVGGRQGTPALVCQRNGVGVLAVWFARLWLLIDVGAHVCQVSLLDCVQHPTEASGRSGADAIFPLAHFQAVRGSSYLKYRILIGIRRFGHAWRAPGTNRSESYGSSKVAMAAPAAGQVSELCTPLCACAHMRASLVVVCMQCVRMCRRLEQS